MDGSRPLSDQELIASIADLIGDQSVDAHNEWLGQVRIQFGAEFAADVGHRWSEFEKDRPRTSEDVAQLHEMYWQEGRRNKIALLMDRDTALRFAATFPAEALRLTTYHAGKGQSTYPAKDFEHGRTADGRIVNAVETHWEELVKAQQAGNEIFFYLNTIEPGAGYGYNGIATNQDVTALAINSVDFDGGLPDAFHVAPDIVIKTSRRTLPDGQLIQRGQALWRSVSPKYEPHQREAMAADFKALQLRLACRYDPEGWEHRDDKTWPKIADFAITDLRRVHRLPGSLHLKDRDNPQPVTFVQHYTGPHRSIEMITADLPGLELGRKPALEHKPASERQPVAKSVLSDALSYVDPGCAEPEWRRIVAAIEGTPLIGDVDAEEIAVEWSRGDLDRDGKYADRKPATWDGDEAVREKFQAAQLARARREATGQPCTGFKTIAEAARMGGMPEDRIPRAWRQAAAAGSYESAREPGSFLLRIGDLFKWPDPTELVHDFLMQGEDACIYSPPKSGKTFVALDIALSLAAGLPVFGKLNVLRPGEAVVYLSGEGHAGMKRRIMAWGQAHGLTPEQTEALPFFYKTDVPASVEGNADALRFVAGIRQFCTPVLVVVDTMARSLGKLDESTSNAAALYLDVTKVLRDAFACTTLTLAHEGKTEGKGVRGSSAFVAGFDAVWHLDANKDNRTAMLEAEWLKDADELGPHCFRIESFYVDGMTNGKGAVLRHIDLKEYRSPKETKEASDSILFVIAELLRARGIHNFCGGLTHAQVAEAMMPTPRPGKDENVNVGLAWETEFQKLRTDVNNACRSKQAKQMGAKEVAQRGRDAEWHWFLPRT
ncbi:MAG: AAA family ATPase [Stellaceae bacterium]